MDEDFFALAEKFVGHPDVVRDLANEFKRIKAANRDRAQVLYDGELETEIIRLRAENERLRETLSIVAEASPNAINRPLRELARAALESGRRE